jgi:hypothetical protein
MIGYAPFNSIALYVTIVHESRRLVNEKTQTALSVWAAEAGMGN